MLGEDYTPLLLSTLKPDPGGYPGGLTVEG